MIHFSSFTLQTPTQPWQPHLNVSSFVRPFLWETVTTLNCDNSFHTYSSRHLFCVCCLPLHPSSFPLLLIGVSLWLAYNKCWGGWGRLKIFTHTSCKKKKSKDITFLKTSVAHLYILPTIFSSFKSTARVPLVSWKSPTSSQTMSQGTGKTKEVSRQSRADLSQDLVLGIYLLGRLSRKPPLERKGRYSLRSRDKEPCN